MAKREKKPKIYRIKLYDTLEEELKSIGSGRIWVIYYKIIKP